MKTIWEIIIVVCLVFVGCGIADSDTKRLADRITATEYGLLDKINALEKSAHDWEDDVIKRIEIMERTWKLANTHEIKQDSRIDDNFYMIDLLFKHLGVEAVWIDGHHKLIRTEDGTHILEIVEN